MNNSHLHILKTSILILIAFALTPSVYSQVGINTKTPLNEGYVLHIDAKGDTDGNTSISDDLIIDNKGNLGLGTSAPEAKLDINGKMRLSDGLGTDYSDCILVNDGLGNVTWQKYLVALKNKQMEWKLDNTNWPDIDTSSNIFAFSGTSTLINKNEMDVTATNTTLSLPKGRYLIFLSSEIEGRGAYAQLRLLNGNDTLISANFINTLSNCADLFEFEEDVELSFSFTIYDVRSNPAKQIGFCDPFPYQGPNHIWTKLEIRTMNIGGELF